MKQPSPCPPELRLASQTDNSDATPVPLQVGNVAEPFISVASYPPGDTERSVIRKRDPPQRSPAYVARASSRSSIHSRRITYTS